MALTMVHLLAADLWARRHPEYADDAGFYYGAISPDAIHVRDHDDKSHKDEIHLYNWTTLHREPVVDYWRRRHTPFDIGYGVHVLTDCQWVQRWRTRLPGILREDGRLNTDIYYNDTFVTDFQLYRANPRLEALLVLLAGADTPHDHPLLTASEFDEWRNIILKAYRGECPKRGPVRFIDVPYVESFVGECVPLIDSVYAETFGA